MDDRTRTPSNGWPVTITPRVQVDDFDTHWHDDRAGHGGSGKPSRARFPLALAWAVALAIAATLLALIFGPAITRAAAAAEIALILMRF